jgi:hypothetical protein
MSAIRTYNVEAGLPIGPAFAQRGQLRRVDQVGDVLRVVCLRGEEPVTKFKLPEADTFQIWRHNVIVRVPCSWEYQSL